MFQIATTNLLAILLWGVVSASALAAEAKSSPNVDLAEQGASAMLMDLIKAFNGVTARFDQRVIDASNQVVDESVGRLLLSRPNFRWQVDEPFEQVIVATGTQVQIYDPDLAQVTLLDFADGLGTTPLMVLLGDTQALLREFTVSQAEQNEQQRFLLYPKADDSLFLQLELRFKDSQLHYLSIWDSAGQLTSILFSELQVQQPIAEQQFKLVLPPGTDVISG